MGIDNFYAEYIMRIVGLEEVQAAIKIAGRNSNNLRYADDTTLIYTQSISSGRHLLEKRNSDLCFLFAYSLNLQRDVEI